MGGRRGVEVFPVSLNAKCFLISQKNVVASSVEDNRSNRVGRLTRLVQSRRRDQVCA